MPWKPKPLGQPAINIKLLAYLTVSYGQMAALVAIACMAKHTVCLLLTGKLHICCCWFAAKSASALFSWSSSSSAKMLKQIWASYHSGGASRCKTKHGWLWLNMSHRAFLAQAARLCCCIASPCCCVARSGWLGDALATAVNADSERVRPQVQ